MEVLILIVLLSHGAGQISIAALVFFLALYTFYFIYLNLKLTLFTSLNSDKNVGSYDYFLSITHTTIHRVIFYTSRNYAMIHRGIFYILHNYEFTLLILLLLNCIFVLFFVLILDKERVLPATTWGKTTRYQRELNKYQSAD